MFRDSMPPVLAAASALDVFKRVPARVVQWLSAVQGTMLACTCVTAAQGLHCQ
jgi:hypothetical protein